MSGDLLDVNVWVAHHAERHAHHSSAARYWQTEAARDMWFCRVTALGYLRLISNSSVTGQAAVTGATALAYLDAVLAQNGVGMATEPLDLDTVLDRIAETTPLSGAHWTDAYLAAFAIAGNYRLVTFDRGFRRFVGLDLLLLE